MYEAEGCVSSLQGSFYAQFYGKAFNSGSNEEPFERR